MKKTLILKAHYDLIEQSPAKSGSIFTLEDFVDSEPMLEAVLHRLSVKSNKFDAVCLFCPSNHEYLSFELTERYEVSWMRLAHLLCQYDLLQGNARIISVGFNGNLLRLAADMFSICNKLSCVYGIPKLVDLSADMMVSMTDDIPDGKYSNLLDGSLTVPQMTVLKCNRTDLRQVPAYETRKWQVYKELEWTNGHGKWIEQDDVICKNVGLYE